MIKLKKNLKITRDCDLYQTKEIYLYPIDNKLKTFKIEINYMLYIKNLKTLVMGGPILCKYDEFGVQQNKILVNEDVIICLVYSKENKSIIAGGLKGNIIIYDINYLSELKRYLFHDGIIYLIIRKKCVFH